jgi:hypothetical protein
MKPFSVGIGIAITSTVKIQPVTIWDTAKNIWFGAIAIFIGLNMGYHKIIHIITV